MEKLSLSRALAEIKLLDARIAKEVNGGKFVTSITGDRKITNANITKDDFEKLSKSSVQSISDLLKRRKTIKQKVSLANATTKVTVGKEEYFIAEAIERKQSIANDINFLNTLKQQLIRTESDVNAKNANMEQKIDSLLSDKMSSEKSKGEEVIEFQKSYRALNETKIFDTIDIRSLIDKLEKEIEDFQSNVDFVLSEINTITTIEIE